MSPSSITSAALVDCLAEAKRRIVRPAAIPPYIEFNSLYVVSRELSVLLPVYDREFMGSLNDTYDSGRFAQRRRGGNLNIDIPDSQINLVAGTTPSYLNSFMPEGAWEQGFTSRTILVYSGKEVPKPLFNEFDEDTKLKTHLITDLKAISSLFGKIDFSEEAAKAIQAWHMSGGAPEPEHPKLTDYCTRRTQHVSKLCMVAAVTRSDFSYRIELEDFQTALNWLVEVESFMPDIFRAMRAGGDTAVIEDTWHFVWSTYTKNKKKIPEHWLIEFVHQRTPSHNVMKIIELMVRSKLLIETVEATGSSYSPAPRISK